MGGASTGIHDTWETPFRRERGAKVLADQTRLVGNLEVITSFVVSQLLGRVVEACVTTDGSLVTK